MRRTIRSSVEYDTDQFNEIVSDEVAVLTPSGLLAFLSQIEELDTNGKLGITTTDDGTGIQVFIGDSIYNLEAPSINNVIEVEDSVVDDIKDINVEGYEELEDEFEEVDEPIKGGIIKELIKTLAIGGLVRLTKNAIEKA